ncbi:MAG TPA: hypothetical protein VNJ01_16700 [Bacteriovoracaceae bacterium]|nr:hypothetical protein [Bacteriovoracaceae bacterium]
MNIRTLGLILLFASTTCYAQGRKPAVEDFIGIEVDQPAVTPQGTEPLFNLEHDLNKMTETIGKSAPAMASDAEPGPWNVNAYFGLIAILGMPLVSFSLILNHLRKKASAESVSNLEVLEKYRREKELARKNQESHKKAS